jgi:hypothetical protein
VAALASPVYTNCILRAVTLEPTEGVTRQVLCELVERSAARQKFLAAMTIERNRAVTSEGVSIDRRRSKAMQGRRLAAVSR